MKRGRVDRLHVKPIEAEHCTDQRKLIVDLVVRVGVEHHRDAALRRGEPRRAQTVIDLGEPHRMREHRRFA